MGLFIERPTPFIPEFLNRMMQLDYPKKRIDLLIHNTVGILPALYINIKDKCWYENTLTEVIPSQFSKLFE